MKTEEFNLSEKIYEDEIDKSDVAVEGGFYSAKDVKEFIRRLKEEYWNWLNKWIKSSAPEFLEKIDSLAGDKLT